MNTVTGLARFSNLSLWNWVPAIYLCFLYCYSCPGDPSWVFRTKTSWLQSLKHLPSDFLQEKSLSPTLDIKQKENPIIRWRNIFNFQNYFLHSFHENKKYSYRWKITTECCRITINKDKWYIDKQIERQGDIERW